jgi:prephenate dehydrogenase
MTKPLFDTPIIGPGLIGSSIMRAARAKGAVRKIVEAGQDTPAPDCGRPRGHED